MENTSDHTHAGKRTLVFCECGAISTDGGEWETGKDPSAVALSAKAIATMSPETRRANSAHGGALRWKGFSKQDRAAFMKWMAQQPRPNARKADRCECGRYTKHTAEKHHHYCGSGLAEAQKRWAALKPEIQRKHGRS